MNLDFQISETYCDLVKAFNFSEIDRLVFHHKDDLKIDSEFDYSDSHNNFSISDNLIFLLKLYQTIFNDRKILEN